MKTKSKGQTTVEVVLGAIVKDSRIKRMGAARNTRYMRNG